MSSEPRRYTAEFNKQPSERITKALDWTRNLSDTITLASVEVKLYELDDNGDISVDRTSTMIHGDSVISGVYQLYTVKAGEDGKDYDISLKATLSNANVLEDDILMHVREIA